MKYTDTMNLQPGTPEYARAAHIMIKPIGPRCNLRCTYCFYLEKHALFPDGESFRMSDDVQERFIRDYIRWQNTPEIEFAWQGGEPTLLGVDFFRRTVALQQHYSDGRLIRNSLQTNGTLLDDEWCAFLAQHKFLVGLSLDGPQDVHDRHRVYADGRGSFQDVMRGLHCLKKHGVEFNSLTCMHRDNGGEGRRIYRFLRDEGIRHMQFIPIVERTAGTAACALGLQLEAPPALDAPASSAQVMPFTILPKQYGQFLIDIFDEWVRRDVGEVFVNHFDVALNAWYGNPPPLCINAKACGNALAMEHDGTVYACDHFVYPEYRRGNILQDSLQKIVFSADQQRFGTRKWTALPTECRMCPALDVCHGGCPKHRFTATSDGQPGLNYLCEGYKAFYTHIAPAMEKMVDLLQQQCSPAEIMRRR